MLAFLGNDWFVIGSFAAFVFVPISLALFTPRSVRMWVLLVVGVLAFVAMCALGSYSNWDVGGDTGRGWTAVATVSVTYAFFYIPLWSIGAVVGALLAIRLDKTRMRARRRGSATAPG